MAWGFLFSNPWVQGLIRMYNIDANHCVNCQCCINTGHNNKYPFPSFPVIMLLYLKLSFDVYGWSSLNSFPSFVFQTYIGSILTSVNPYKLIPGLYDQNTSELYSRHHMGEIPPHIFAVANECYRCLWKRHDNQCVLIR